MSHAPHNIPAAASAESAPAVSRGAVVPVWLIVLLVLIVFGGGLYFDRNGAWFDPQVYGPYQTFADLERYQPKREGPDLARGKAVFEAVCGLCHGVDGNGKPGQAPPLAGSEWATGNPDRMIRIPLYGLSGSISVKGQEWSLAMPAMGAALSNDDLAAVLTYIRASWGNQASPITPEQLQAVKTKVGSRSQPFTASELSAIQ